jgi:hypothetical protein
VNVRRLGLLLLVAGCNGQLRFDEPRDAGALEAGSSGCVRDEDCSAASLRCDVVSGECVACVADADCSDPRAPRCDAALQRCVACGGDLDCGAGETCLPQTRTCVMRCEEGVAENLCPATAPTCDEVARICVQCQRDQDCAAITDDGPYCERASGRCVRCTDDRQCPATRPRCDRLQHRCAQCSSARDCPAGGGCNLDTLSCT